MPVQFLTAEQRSDFGGYITEPTPMDLARYFHLDDADHQIIGSKRGNHNRLGFAVQLTTVRFLGRFLDDTTQVPSAVLNALARQLGLNDPTRRMADYHDQRQRLRHIEEIRRHCNYREISEPSEGFRLTRWLYAQCWTGTDRPTVLFERATSWLLAHKVLIPGVSTLERFVAKLRARVEMRLWRLLIAGVTPSQQAQLEDLLLATEGSRNSQLDQLRKGPTRVSGPSLVHALLRLQSIRDLGIALPAVGKIASSRLAALARFASTSKVTAITRLPDARRLATLVAFVHCLEATAHDDALDVLDMLLRELFNDAIRADKKVRLRKLKDLDQAATILADACEVLIDTTLPETELRKRTFSKTPHELLSRALAEVRALVRPPDDVYYQTLQDRYRSVRGFLPAVLQHLRFGASPAGEPLVAALDWLRTHDGRAQSDQDAPREVIRKQWQHHVVRDDDTIDARAYAFCVLDELRTALKRRDVFVAPSWRYADPRAGLLAGAEWDAARPVICRTLGLPTNPEPALTTLAIELDQTYRAVAARLPDNPAVRFEENELVLSPLDKLDEPASLIALRAEVLARLPRADLPEILLEIAARTGFTDMCVTTRWPPPMLYWSLHRAALVWPRLGVEARSRPLMACVSWYRCAPSMPAPIRSILESAAVSPGTTWSPTSSVA